MARERCSAFEQHVNRSYAVVTYSHRLVDRKLQSHLHMDGKHASHFDAEAEPACNRAGGCVVSCPNLKLSVCLPHVSQNFAASILQHFAEATRVGEHIYQLCP